MKKETSVIGILHLHFVFFILTTKNMKGMKNKIFNQNQV